MPSAKPKFFLEESGYERDGFGVFYHMKLKKDINARAESHRLQSYCKECVTKDPIRIMSDNVKSMNQYLYSKN